MKSKALLIVSTLFFSIISFGQIPINYEKKVDDLFKSWDDDANKPGVATVIIKDGKVIYLKAFGSANLETDTKITPQTMFQLGEMSKQFTTLAILQLVEQGTISLSEDIRKYITELPKYEHVITISHLLNHSSGLYDVNKVYSVINGSQSIPTQQKVIQLIATQKALAFKPGTDFSFHEAVTESVLMAEIVTGSSGQSFSEYVKSNIFQPLGMTNSLIRDDSKTILKNAALPYLQEENKDYKSNPVNSNVVGAINAYTSAEDLAKWYSNYHKPQGNLGQLILKLDDLVVLSNGKKNVYYWGEMAIGREFTHPERGLPIYWSFGMQGGYGANVFRYLNQKLISFTIGNNNQYNGGLAHDAMDVLVEDLYPLPSVIDFESLNVKKLSTKKLKSFEGHYWFKEGYASELFVKNDTLRTKWLFSNRDRHQTLVPLSNNTFIQYAEMEDQRRFKFEENGNDMTLYFTYNQSRPDVMKRYKPVNITESELQAYAGTYYNKAYESLFSFYVENGELVAKSLNHSDIVFKPITKDVFTSRSMFFNSLEFIRNNSNKIKGFKMITDGIQGLEFEKNQN